MSPFFFVDGDEVLAVCGTVHVEAAEKEYAAKKLFGIY